MGNVSNFVPLTTSLTFLITLVYQNVLIVSMEMYKTKHVTKTVHKQMKDSQIKSLICVSMSVKNTMNLMTVLPIFTQGSVSLNVQKINLQSKITIPENANPDAHCLLNLQTGPQGIVFKCVPMDGILIPLL